MVLKKVSLQACLGLLLIEASLNKTRKISKRNLIKNGKNCVKYKPRKLNKRPENIKIKKRKDRDRHDNWKKDY